jgi:CBS-domain-containing membrane protein
MTPTKSLLDLTAADLMSRDVVTIHRRTSLRTAAHLLRRTGLTWAPVVDEQGRCVGMLSTLDILRWVERDGPGAEPQPIRTCPYQTQGRLLTDEEGVICTLAEGSCPLQAMLPMTAGRHTARCMAPHDLLADWQQVLEDAPADEAGNYMTANIVIVRPDAHWTDLARMTTDSHIHRVVVADEFGRPVGIVSAADVRAAAAREEADLEGP